MTGGHLFSWWFLQSLYGYQGNEECFSFYFFNNTYPLPYSVFPEKANQDLKSVEDIFHSLKCQLTAVCLSIPHFHPRLSIRTSVLNAVFFFCKGLRWLSHHYQQFLSLVTHDTIKYPCTYHHGYTSASHGGTAELSSALARAAVSTDCSQSQKVALYLVCKLWEAQEHLDTGLDWLSVTEQNVLMNWQTQQKT